LRAFGWMQQQLRDPQGLPIRVRLLCEAHHLLLDGRIGRLLIAALMERWGQLREPLMQLSGYLRQHQAEQCRHLSAIREHGDREGWVACFLEGVAAAAADQMCIHAAQIRCGYR
jgi:hypothetical protein